MALEQIYRLEKRVDYFAGFIQEIGKKEGVVFSLEFVKNDLVLTLFEEDPIKKEEFLYKIASLVPNSRYLKEIVVREVEKDLLEKRVEVLASFVEICPQCLKVILDEESDLFLDTAYRCSHYLDFSLEEKEYFDPQLAKLEIEDGVSFSTFETTFTKEPTKNILILNPYFIEDLFVMTEEEKNQLMSLERPIVSLKISDETLRRSVGESANVRLFYDSFTASLGAVYKEERDYLFYH